MPESAWRTLVGGRSRTLDQPVLRGRGYGDRDVAGHCWACSVRGAAPGWGEMAQDDQESAGGEDFAALLAASEQRAPRLSAGELVRGRVVSVGATAAFVEIGGKGEAVIDLAEFRDPETGAVQLAVGDQIEATVVDDGSTSGTVVLKRTVGRGGHVPGELEQALGAPHRRRGRRDGREQGRLRGADRRRARVLPRLADRSAARSRARPTSASACASASPGSKPADATSSSRAATCSRTRPRRRRRTPGSASRSAPSWKGRSARCATSAPSSTSAASRA